MIPEILVNVGIVAVTCLLLIIYLIRFVIRYKHEYEYNPLCTSTVLICLLVVFVTIFILPVDIFLVSFVKDADGKLKNWATNETLASIDKVIFTTYYTLYSIITILTLIVIPFLNFFHEESESNLRDRLHNAIKYTCVSTLVVLLVFTLGALINDKQIDSSSVFANIIDLSSMTRIQNAVSLVMALITTAGLINVSFYTAFGIISWPISLILKTANINRLSEMDEREELLRMRIRRLRDKATQSQLTPAESNQLIQAEADLRDIENAGAALPSHGSNCIYVYRKAIRCIQSISGIMCGSISLILLAALFTVNIDRILHGSGFKQGYMLLEPQLFNLLEYIFIKLQDITVVGPLPILIITCFLVIATISGIRNLGLWFLFAKLYHIKVGRTQPQALLLFCITIMLAAFSFNSILYSMSTQYITFGNQISDLYQSNGTWIAKPCNIADHKNNCVFTRASILLMRMMSQSWIFGAIFYWFSWAYIGVSAISLVRCLVRGRRDATHGIVMDADEFED